MYLDTLTSDVTLSVPKFDEFIKTYQDPKEVDKLLKIENTLNEVNQIVHKSLDDVRGVEIDLLAAETGRDIGVADGEKQGHEHGEPGLLQNCEENQQKVLQLILIYIIRSHFQDSNS